MTGRAETPEQKRAVIERILAAWERCPNERLGHLISESLRNIEFPALAAVGDRELANLVERFVAPRSATAEENFEAKGKIEAEAFTPESAAALATALTEESRDLTAEDPRRAGRTASTLMDVYLRGRKDGSGA